MSETQPSPKQQQHYNREQVLSVLGQLVKNGFTSPDDLPLDDPQVIEAGKILEAWSADAAKLAQQSPLPGAISDYTLSRSTIYVDAGFSDSKYLAEVANDWLQEELQEAQDAGNTAAAEKIQAKIDQINSRLA